MLVFIAPDLTNAEAWELALREYLAWKSIDNDAEPLNLDKQQSKQVASALKRTEETLLVRLQETYSWLIVPIQPDPTGPIEYQAHRISGQDSFYDRAARKLRQSELLIPRWSPDNLRMELDRYLWRDQNHLGIKQLWEYLARYCYLPRLYDEAVLLDAITDGVRRDDAPFGYATTVTPDNTYTGLSLGNHISIYFDDNAVIIRPEIAHEQLEAMRKAQDAAVNLMPDSRPTRDDVISEPIQPEQPKLTTRYHGTISLDPQRVNREMGMIVEEIIQRLTSLTDTDVEITLEISANRPSGFDDATIRTINENSRTLKFKNHGFED